MKYPSVSMTPVRQKVILLTGGVNEEVNSIQQNAGELFSCTNYEEIGGKNSGYTSVKGYEVFDGQTSPTSVAVDTYRDSGIDTYTALLLESDVESDIINSSSYSTTVTNTGVTNSTDKFKLGTSSFKFDGVSYLTATDTAKLDFSQDFCVEFKVYYANRLGTFNILEKTNSLHIYLEDGFVMVRGSTDGISYDISLDSDALVSDSSWKAVSVTLEGTLLTIYLDGVPQATTATASGDILNNTTDTVIGSGLVGYLDDIRVSTGSFRYPQIYLVPTVRFSFNDFYVEYVDDGLREAARTAILEIPGEDAPLGVIYYNNNVYSFRNDTTIAKMYKATAAGWVEVVQPVGYEFAKDGTFKFSVYRFDGYNSNQPVLVITDGVSIPRLYDGTTITPLTSTQLPEYAAVPKYAARSGAYNNRLFLGYKEGSIVFSNIGNPESYSSIIGGSGELFLGDELTNIVESPGNTLVLTCKNFIKIIKDVEMSSAFDWSIMMDTFSSTSGAIDGSAQALLGDVYFADDEGVTSLGASDMFGDFNVSVISNKVQKSFLANRALTTTSLTDRSSNQYRLYFNNGEAFYFTFDTQKRVKGVTKVLYPIPVMSATKGEDTTGNVHKFFVSTTGYVYEMDTGTSFNGVEINTGMSSSYYSYNSPRNWKNFKRLVLEVDADRGLRLAYRTTFDYSEAQVPKVTFNTYVTKGIAGIWGQDSWGDFSWGGSQIQRLVLYLRGSGANMSIEVRSSSKYKEQHVLHNGIVDYSVGARQL